MSQLERYACMWWPKEVRDYADKLSILQTLLDTQEKFISILKLADSHDPESIFRIMKASKFSMKCFLKHLMVLTDIELKQIQEINKNFTKSFPDGKMMLNESVAYYFHVLPIKCGLTYEIIKLDRINEEDACEEKYLFEDLIMLLLYHVTFSNELHVADFIGGNSTQMSELKDFMTLRLVINWNKHNHVSIWCRLKNKFYNLCA